MAKRRGHGEGSVTLLKDGRWRAYISLGKNKRKYFYGKTQKEVIAKLQKGQREKQQGTLITTPDQPLKVYLTRWLEVYKPTVRLATYNIRRLIVQNHIIPALGDIPLQRLTPQEVRVFYASELERGLKGSSVGTYHVTLHKALDRAAKDGLIARNVCDLVDPPKSERVEMTTLNKDQALQFLSAARGHRLELLFTMAITTGMRQGELLGLRWSDIDMERGTLSVRRTIKRVGKYGIIETEPKTAKGKRQISIPPFILDMLRVHQDQQTALRMAAGEKWQDRGMVFCTDTGGYFEGQRVHKPFKQLLAAAGLPDIRFHDLRHSAATLLLAMKEHPKVVQELLGHSSITTTLMTYSHVLPIMHEEAMRKMGDMFKRDK